MPRISSVAVLGLLLAVFLVLTPVVNAAPEGVKPLDEVALHRMPAVDLPALILEDLAREGVPGIPLRLGFPMATDLSPAGSGTWEELPGGDRLWRLRVRSAGALWMVLGFGTYRLQPGGELRVYDRAGETVLGPFTSNDIREHGQLWFPPIAGDEMVIEVHWPASLGTAQPNIHLGTVSHGYKAWGEIGATSQVLDDVPEGDEPQPAGSGSCNIDVNCPLGDDWQDQKRGVVHLLSGGSSFCSASLVNNTANDCRPFVLTADHCGAGPSTTFRFNYERPGCESGTAPTGQTSTGASVRAEYGPSDFTLLEMDNDPPEAFDAYFNGWSRSTTPGTESWGIHHPSGDPKKISFNADPLIDGPGGSGWGSDHWRVTEWEDGTTEGGSSGSPLFDQNQRIVGQLHGGFASCSNITWDEYGKVDVSWGGGGTSSTRLSDWLDPTGTGAVTLDGRDQVECLNPLPALEVVGQTVQDLTGNTDGNADPGETLTLQIDLKNNGDLNATGVRGTLVTPGPLASVSRPVVDWPDIAQGQSKTSATPHFGLQVDPAQPCGQSLQLQLELTATELTEPVVALLELPIGDPQSETRFSDDVEGGTNGWTQQQIVRGFWSQVTSDSNSGTTSWFTQNLPYVLDTALSMPVVTAVLPGTVLTFQHRYNTENNRDGSVLEYSSDGGAWQDAGPLIVSGGYNSSIGAGENSSLAGRSVWAGDSGGWREVRVELSSLAGSDVAMRWRFAANDTVGDEGWYVDDVVVERVWSICDPLTAPPGEASAVTSGAGPLTIGRAGTGGFALAWSSPLSGGAAITYRLYQTPLQGTPAPDCETELGTGTAVELSSLSDDSGLLVVAVNSLGEGSYGRDSVGAERPQATGGAVCP